MPVSLHLDAIKHPTERARGFSAGGAAWLITVALMWLWAWRHLSDEWRLNEQYQYGFAVPFLAAYIGWSRFRKWAALPDLAQCGRSIKSAAVSIAILFGFVASLGGELLRQQDPAWRLGGGLLTLGASVMTSAWFFCLGGPPLLRQMAFPLFFCWLAVPWPHGAELAVTSNLLRLLMTITVLVLNLNGIAALQRGNIIELENGLVGIEDACSGVQSLQASFVATLFFGEFFRLTAGRRWLLFYSGLGIALLGNLLRVIALTLLIYRSGQDAAARYHDTVGLAATAGTFLGILAFGWVLFRKKEGRADQAHSLTRDGHEANRRLCVLTIPRAVQAHGLFALLLILPVPLLVWSWFAAVTPGMDNPRQRLWRVQTVHLTDGWVAQPVQVLPAEQRILRFSEGQSVKVRSPEGISAQVFHFYWRPEESMPSASFAHTPNICMRSAGWEPVGSPVTIELRVGGQPLRGALFRFRHNQIERAVFQHLSPTPFFGQVYAGLERKAHLALLWKAPRQRVTEELLVYMSWLGNLDEQRSAFEELLGQVLLPVR